jgi:hypothetical protein
MNQKEVQVRAAPLVPIPFVKIPLKGSEVDAVQVGPRKFLIFVDPRAFDLAEMATCKWPEGWEDLDAMFIPCTPRPGMSVIDSLALVEQLEDPAKDSA